MSSYIKLSTLEYPRHEGDIRREHPEIREDQTWPDFPCPDTYALVEQTPVPEVTRDQWLSQLPPVLVDGTWRTVWEVRDMTAEEIAQRDRAYAEAAARRA
jgi:hypothetical protein